MGLLDKVKNLFTEEVDEPVKKDKKIKKEEPRKEEIHTEEKTVEIAPARKETADLYKKEIEEISEIKVEKKPEKAASSLYFDDDDFLDLPKREEPKKEESKDTKRTSFTRDIYSEIKEIPKFEYKKSEAKPINKKFKPSPIISPVYGVLDKNYKKEEVSSTIRENPYKSDKITVDDVRNKAFGTLEDELENTLTSSIVINDKVDDKAINIFDELEIRKEKNTTEDLSAELAKQKQQIEEINEIIKTSVAPEKKKVTSRKIDNILEELDEIEDLIPTKDKKEKIEEAKIEDTNDDLFEEMPETIEEAEEIKEEVKENNDNLEEGDLFNLIDSMYEKRDDE